MNLRLYKYNNYYNRRIKSISSLSDIDNFLEYTEYDINFNPNDGVLTEHVMGGLSTYSGSADYAILEEQNEIVSRWFIVESQRTRNGQYKLTLKRDSIADFYPLVMEAPCFIEKGWVPSSDPAVFNKEDLTFNQIKKKEVLLKDKTGIPWIVGYYNKNSEALSVNVEQNTPIANYTVNGLQNWTYHQYIANPAKVLQSFDTKLYFKASDLPDEVWVEYQNITDAGSTLSLKSTDITELGGSDNHYTIDTDSFLWGVIGNIFSSIDQAVLNKLTENMKAGSNDLFDAADALFQNEGGYKSSSIFDTLDSLQGAVIFDSSDGTYYEVTTTTIYNSKETITLTPSLTSTFGYTMYDIYAATQTDSGGIYGSRPAQNSDNIDFAITAASYKSIRLGTRKLSVKSSTVSINPEPDVQTQNSPYNIFAIPYGEVKFFDPNASKNIFTDKELALRVASALISKYSGADPTVLHDVQLLPYCPCKELLAIIEGKANPRVNLSKLDSKLWTAIKSTDDETLGYIFHCTSSSLEFEIQHYIPITDVKIQNETEFCRLVSPNWNGMFEFSPAKNYGVESFEVDVEFKPYQPYIHIAPKFSNTGLYGNRENDAIGLICGGDFGLTMTSSAWAQYERQNKNYQQIFDRGVQNLEVQQKYQRLTEQIGAFTGAASAGVSGAATGAMAGGPYAAIAGGIAGASLSLAAGLGDVRLNDQLRKEAIDYTKDLFGYQMGNIKALPDSLTKVNSLNPNNTIFPMLEFYGCTDREVEALRNKIKYNGMSIGRVGALKDYKNPEEETYVKGQVIVLEIEDDYHLASDIANEIYKGVRI